jgi:hypothetical protein
MNRAAGQIEGPDQRGERFANLAYFCAKKVLRKLCTDGGAVGIDGFNPTRYNGHSASI